MTHRETMLVVLGVLLPVFMGSLDNTILASALPTIGKEFGDVHNLPWLVTAYLIANTAITALYGKISDIHGRRITLLIACSLYMLGSLVCALAPNMFVLILGRVLHGLGGGGLTSTGMVMSRIPNTLRASMIAPTTAASAGVVPPSPPALMPSKLLGDSTSTISALKDGKLCDRGMP